MNILDENVLASQRQLLIKWRVRWHYGDKGDETIHTLYVFKEEPK